MSKEPDRRTVKDIDHTAPHTDEPFGESGVYDRGKVARSDSSDPTGEGERVGADVDGEGATDRVESEPAEAGPDRDEDRPRLVKDLDHTPPDEVGAQRTFDRGEEAPAPGRAGMTAPDRGGGADRPEDGADRPEDGDDPDRA